MFKIKDKVLHNIVDNCNKNDCRYKRNVATIVFQYTSSVEFIRTETHISFALFITKRREIIYLITMSESCLDVLLEKGINGNLTQHFMVNVIPTFFSIVDFLTYEAIYLHHLHMEFLSLS